MDPIRLITSGFTSSPRPQRSLMSVLRFPSVRNEDGLKRHTSTHVDTQDSNVGADDHLQVELPDVPVVWENNVSSLLNNPLSVLKTSLSVGSVSRRCLSSLYFIQRGVKVVVEPAAFWSDMTIISKQSTSFKALSQPTWPSPNGRSFRFGLTLQTFSRRPYFPPVCPSAYPCISIVC